MSRDKVKGMFLGAAIGDALGMPVECFSAEKIKEVIPDGKITSYLKPSSHKDGMVAGGWTDDTQLTIAVAEALMLSDNPLSMNSQAVLHVEALKKYGACGWGGTTRKAVKNLRDGMSWEDSGIYLDGKGAGNGVAMKVSPVAAYLFALDSFSENRGGKFHIEQQAKTLSFLCNLSLMTHKTSVGLHSGFAQAFGIWYCLETFAEDFDPSNFVSSVSDGCRAGEMSLAGYPEPIIELEDCLVDRLEFLFDYQDYDTDKIIATFGAGSCYAFDSIPFTHMFFIKNPTIEGLYDVISAGGDTDSNGSMFAAMLGALHGASVFPEELVNGLQDVTMLSSLAGNFCDKFNIHD